jgi:TrwC relaxase
MTYYTASGEPPGQWSGKAAASPSLSGAVDAAVIENLYQEGIGPGGQPRAARIMLFG